jgi:hypothetical protein
MKISSFFGIAAISLLFLVSSCLTCETKEYKFAFTGKGKGTLTVKYNNIFSKNNDEELTMKEELQNDYDELMDDYMKGDQLVSVFPNAKLVSRRLYEENGKLNGEAIYEFSTIGQIHLFQTDAKGPYMFLLNSFSFETVTSTNGTQGPDYFNAIYWNKKLKNLEFNTSVDELDEVATSLLPMWKAKSK